MKPTELNEPLFLRNPAVFPLPTPLCPALSTPAWPCPLASAISTTMTRSSFSCGLSSEMSECSVSVQGGVHLRRTGMPITTDTAGMRRVGPGRGGTPRRPPSACPGPYLRSALAHAHGGCRAAFLGQQVRQVVEAVGRCSTCLCETFQGFRRGVLWVGVGKGRSDEGLPTSLAPPPSRSPASPGRRPQVRLLSPSRSACLGHGPLDLIQQHQS